MVEEVFTICSKEIQHFKIYFMKPKVVLPQKKLLSKICI